jgi:hypothetical protein
MTHDILIVNIYCGYNSKGLRKVSQGRGFLLLTCTPPLKNRGRGIQNRLGFTSGPLVLFEESLS